MATATLRTDAEGGEAARADHERDGSQLLHGLLIGLRCMGRAAIVIDDRGRVIGSTALARPLVEALARTCPTQSIAAHRGLMELAHAALHPGHAGEEIAAIVDLPRMGRAIVHATDVRSAAPGLFDHASVLLDVARLGLDNLPSPAFLRRVLGLTATEAEVALALACGATASAIARDRSVSLETVRSHLKTIFAKTGTRRQASLVALVLQLRGVSPPA